MDPMFTFHQVDILRACLQHVPLTPVEIEEFLLHLEQAIGPRFADWNTLLKDDGVKLLTRVLADRTFASAMLHTFREGLVSHFAITPGELVQTMDHYLRRFTPGN